jgi:hypothetical protein
VAASRFWYDLAVSTSEPQLTALLSFAPPTKILYGSYFPYAPKAGIHAGLLQYSKFFESGKGERIGPARLKENATRLRETHQSKHCFLPGAQDNGEVYNWEFRVEDNDDARQARDQLYMQQNI